jgi:hypothetical protein
MDTDSVVGQSSKVGSVRPLGGPITDINANLERLRDFVDTLDASLAAKRDESINVHREALMPLLLAFDRARELDEHLTLEPLAEEQKLRLKQQYPDAETTEVKASPGGGVTITFGASQRHDSLEAIRVILRDMGRTKMLYSSSLMNLTSNVELFFSSLLHVYFARHPEAIGTKEKIFSFDDLNAFASIADARAHYVLSKIEDLLRGSLGDWLSYARTIIKLSMGYLKEDQPALEESFQRRNLVIHNGGIANSIYLSKVSDEFRENVGVGTDMTPDRMYLHTRIDLWERSCLLIGAELWKQLAPADAERAGTLTGIAYKHLLVGRWRIAEALSEFVLRDRQMPETAITSAQLNYWQARKRQGQWDAIREEVQRADFSAKSDVYQLALSALLNDRDSFFSRLRGALKSGAISEQDLREWPIFVDVRADARYAQYSPAPVKRRRPKSKASRKTRPPNDAM